MAAAAAFDDLQPCTVFPSDWGTLAVGWLSKDKPFTTGPVAPELLRALHRLGKPSCVLTYERRCELCPPRTGYMEAGLLFVPSTRGLFVAPRMVIHYIRSHGYRPPEEFLSAVRECPPGDSPEYRTALEAGPGGAQRPQPRLRGEDDIEVLQLPDAIRRRPVMYVGSTGIDGIREFVRVVVQQAVVEHYLGFATRVRVEIDDGWLTVEDDGRGVGTGVVERFGRPVIEALFTNMRVDLGAGRGAMRLPPSLDINVANALSMQMEVTSTGEAETQWAVFENGRLVSLRRGKALAMQGLRIRCLPDPVIFDGKLEPAHVEEELTQLAWLCPRLEVSFQGRVVPNREGPLAWVRALAPGLVEETGLTAHEVGAVHVDVGLGWSRNQRAPNLVSLVNFRRTSGGSHEEGLLAALRRAATRRGAEADRLLAGLTAVVHVSLDDQALEGEPGRWTLNSPEAAACVERAVTCAIDAAPWWWDRLCEAM